MRVLSLFSGIGLHDLGLTRAGMEIVGQCEIDPFALAVLEKWWPNVHRWKDVKDVTVESIREKCGHIDLITGGFPCTQISAAGKGGGIGTEENPTEKSGLVWELLRIIRGVRSHWLVLENVPRLRTLGADEILYELEQAGYTCWPLVVGAEHVGLPHRRHRVWIVGHLADAARNEQSGQRTSAWANGQRVGSGSESLADTTISGFCSGAGLRDDGESRGRRESDGGSQDIDVAHANSCRSGEDSKHSELRPSCIEQSSGDSRASCSGEAEQIRTPRADGLPLVADSIGAGLAERRELPIGTREKESVFAGGDYYRSPKPPGPDQWEWEPARLIKFEVRGRSTRSLRRLVRTADDNTIETLSLDAAHENVLKKWANEQSLRCYGNANPPHAIELIGKAILNISQGKHLV